MYLAFALLAGNSAPQPVPTDAASAAELTEAIETVQSIKLPHATATNDAVRLAIANELADRAADRLSRNQIGHGYMGRAAGAMLSRSGDNEGALAALRTVADAPETPHDKIESLRQIARIHLGEQRFREAADVLREAHQFGLAQPAAEGARWADSFANVTDTFAALHSHQLAAVSFEEAIDALAGIADAPDGTFDRDRVWSALTTMVLMHHYRGHIEQERDAIRRLRERFPNHGFGTPGAWFQVRWLDLNADTVTNGERAATLEELWLALPPGCQSAVVVFLSDRLAAARIEGGDVDGVFTLRQEALELIPDSNGESRIQILNRVIDDAIRFGRSQAGLAALTEADRLLRATRGQGYPAFDSMQRRIDAAANRRTPHP